jgi:hypothetical protein
LITLSALKTATENNSVDSGDDAPQSFVVQIRLDQTEDGKTETISAPRMVINPSSYGTMVVGSETDNFEIRIKTGTLDPKAIHLVSFQITSRGEKLLSPRLILTAGNTSDMGWTWGAKSYMFTCNISKR